MDRCFWLVARFLDGRAAVRLATVSKLARSEIRARGRLVIEKRDDLLGIACHDRDWLRNVAELHTSSSLAWFELGCIPRLELLSWKQNQNSTYLAQASKTLTHLDLATWPSSKALPEMPLLKTLAVGRFDSHFWFSSLAKSCPRLETLTVLQPFGLGQLEGLEHLQSFSIRDWAKDVPSTLRVLKSERWPRDATKQYHVPSNRVEIAKVLRKLDCESFWSEVTDVSKTRRVAKEPSQNSATAFAQTSRALWSSFDMLGLQPCKTRGVGAVG